MMGREYMGVFRTTYLIDQDGTIIHVFENVKPADHSTEILAKLKRKKKIKKRTDKLCVPGGDGGNRTRVRKNRSADIYERSRLLVSSAGIQATKSPTG